MRETTTLRDLAEEAGASAFALADAGNGAGYGESGHMVEWDGFAEEEFGDTVLKKLDTPHVSDDGMECLWASEWIITGKGDNPYRVRIYF